MATETSVTAACQAERGLALSERNSKCCGAAAPPYVTAMPIDFYRRAR